MSTEERSRKVVAALAALSTLLVVALVVVSVLAAHWHSHADKAQRRADGADADAAAGRAALDQARKDLVDLTTYSYRTAGKDDAWLDDFADAKTAKPFAANQKAITRVVRLSKTVAKGTVEDAMTRVVSPTDVEVMAFVDQVLVSRGQKRAHIEEQRVSMTMKRVDDAWKIARIDLGGGNGDT